MTTHHADGTTETRQLRGGIAGADGAGPDGIETFAAVPRPFWTPDEERFAWLRDRRLLAAGLLVVAAVLGLVWVLQTPAAPSAAGNERAASPSSGSPSSGGAQSRATTTSQPAKLTVHVAGAVARAGIVQLAPGARVVDAVTAAGGPQPEADLTRLNLAAPVADGMQVLVAKTGEPLPAGGPAQATGGGDGIVNLNTATAAELDTLPGIGPTRAAAIIAERDAHGPFASVDELQRVKGLGAARIDELRARVRT